MQFSKIIAILPLIASLALAVPVPVPETATSAQGPIQPPAAFYWPNKHDASLVHVKLVSTTQLTKPKIQAAVPGATKVKASSKGKTHKDGSVTFGGSYNEKANVNHDTGASAALGAQVTAKLVDPKKFYKENKKSGKSKST